MQQERDTLQGGPDGERRRQPRSPAARIALAEIGGAQYAAATRDISSGGFQVWIVGAEPVPRDEVAVEVAFEGGIRGFRGRVAYSFPRDWGCVVGLRCDGGVPDGLVGQAGAQGTPEISWVEHG